MAKHHRMTNKKRAQIQQAFQTYRNLLFYPNSPERLFFFQSLSYDQYYNNHTTERQDMYMKRSLEVFTSGKNYLTNNRLTNPEGMLTKGSQEYLKKMDYIKAFLQKAIQQQRNAEIAYFTNIISDIEDRFQDITMPQEVKLLIDFFQQAKQKNTNFDEQQFNDYILYINDLLQGRDNTIAIINDEHQRLQALESATQNIRQIFIKDILQKEQIKNKLPQPRNFDDLSDIQQRKILSQANKKIKARYLKQGRLTSRAEKDEQTEIDKQINKAMKGITPTIDNRLAEFVNKVANQLLNSSTTIDAIKQLITNRQYSSIQDVLPQIRTQIITSTMAWAVEHINDIFNQGVNRLPLVNIEQEIINQMQGLYRFEIDNIPSNFGQSQGLNFFDRLEQQESQARRSGEGLYTAVKNFSQSLTTINNRQLTQDEILVARYLGLSTQTGNFGPSTRNQKILDDIQKLERLQQIIFQRLREYQPITAQDLKQLGIVTSKDQPATIDVRLTSTGEIQLQNSPLAKILQKNHFITKKTITSQTLSTFISSLKGAASKAFRDQFNNAVLNSGCNQMVDLLRTHLENIELKIKGSTLSELAAGFQLIRTKNGKLQLYFGGTQNNKTDFVSISTRPQVTKLRKQLSNQLETYFRTNLDAPIQNLLQQKQSTIKKFQEQFVEDMENLKTNASGYHDYMKKAKSFFQRYNEHRQYMQKILDDYEEANEQFAQIHKKIDDAKNVDKKNKEKTKQILMKLKEQLKNTIYRSDTVKTYNEVQNDIGFLGGSIGTHLQQQIESINQLFTEAGMGLNYGEIVLLESLIINTSDESIIGNKYLGTIERYLSAIAAFALFDEGGAEIEMIKDKLTYGPSQKAGPDILHLYRLDSVYYPGSYILQETLKGIMELSKVMTVNTHGVKVAINNPINYNIIPNHHWQTGQAITTYVPWQQVSDYAQDNVELQITFLAGMMQILTNLRTRMQEISLPA